MASVLEALMVVCFGVSWPLSIIKSYKSRSNKGKSFIFLLFILIGYAFGIVSKIISGKLTYVFIFYWINLFMVLVDLILYLRNKNLEQNEKNAPKHTREFDTKAIL